MITFKSSIIKYPELEGSVQLVVDASITDALRDLNQPWELEDEADYGLTVQTGNRDIVCIIADIKDTKTILHELIHAIDMLYGLCLIDFPLDQDELYVRYVSELQFNMLKEINNEIHSN